MIVTALIISGVLTLLNIGGRNLIIMLLAFDLIFFAFTVGCAAYFFSFMNVMWNADLLFAAIAFTVIAAAESAVGLALIARLHRTSKTIIVKKFNE